MDTVDWDQVESHIEASAKIKVDRFIATLPPQMMVSRKRLEVEQEEHFLLDRVKRLLPHVEYKEGWEVKVGHADEFVRHQKGSAVFVYATKDGMERPPRPEYILVGDSDEIIVEAIFRAFLAYEMHDAANNFRFRGKQVFPREAD
jgi:hypothetical protein